MAHIVYTDETSIHSLHTNVTPATDGTNAGLLAPVTKRRVTTVHADGENGFIPNALFMFKGGTNYGENHHEINFDNYGK
jgi:hypothetical protein